MVWVGWNTKDGIIFYDKSLRSVFDMLATSATETREIEH